MPITQPIIQPLTDPLLIAMTQRSVGGGGGSAGEALLAEARIFVDWADAANWSGKVAINQNDPRPPSLNLITFPTGLIVNETGGVSPTKTNYSVNWTDADGTTDATRFVATGANQNINHWVSASSPAIPDGTYGLRIRAIAASGTGPWTINMGLSTALTARSAQDLDWTNASNTVATTLSVEFTRAGAGDVVSRLATSGADVRVDRIQWYAGGLASIPDWDAEIFTGGRPAFAFDGAITLVNENMRVASPSGAGAIIYEPDFADHTYSEITMIHVGSLDTQNAVGVAYGLALPSDSRLGNTLTTTCFVGYDGGSVATFGGEVTTKPGSTSRAGTGLNVVGQGIQIIGQTLSATKQVRYFDAVPVTNETVVFSGFIANHWRVMSATTTQRSYQASFQTFGDCGMNIIFDRALSVTEYGQVVAAIKARMAARALGTFNDFHVVSGDSNATRAAGDWTQVVSAPGYFSPEPNMFLADTAVGGQGLGNIENGDLNTWTGVYTSSGRFELQDGPALLAAANSGAQALYHICVGTNDWPRINADPSAYLAAVQALADRAKALHPNVSVMLYTILPQFSPAPSTATGFDTLRLAHNAALITWAGTQSRVYVCDVGSVITSGDITGVDGIHLVNPAGDAVFAGVVKTAVESWRTAVGL